MSNLTTSGDGGPSESTSTSTTHLYEFMNDHRERILAECHAELLQHEPSTETLESLREFYDEMLRAIRRESGVPESYSPLPLHSETAARLGSAQQLAGFSPAKVLAIFGAISQWVAGLASCSISPSPPTSTSFSTSA
jgi:hypothetical protein